MYGSIFDIQKVTSINNKTAYIFFQQSKQLNDPNFFASVSLQLKSTTVMILSFRTNRSGQTVQTQIRLLLEEQCDQGLPCFDSIYIFLTKYPKIRHLLFEF